MTLALPRPALSAAALTRAIEQHPYPATGEITVSRRVETDAQALWEELIRLDNTAREQRLARLTEFELRILVATVRTRIERDGVAEILAAAVEHRQVAGAMRAAWDCYLLSDGAPALRAIALQYAAGEPNAAKLAELLRRDPPSAAAADGYLRQGRPFVEWLAAFGPAVSSLLQFDHAVRRRLLSFEWVGTLDSREGGKTLDAWASLVIPATKRPEWYTEFLGATFRRGWPPKHPVLESILTSFREPSAGNSFWARLDAYVISAFELWIKDGKLAEILGEGERLQFWRRFLPDVVDIKPSRDRQVAFLRFDGWFAVQFREMGTATYMFPDKYFNRIVAPRNWDDIRAQVLRHQHLALARYAHHGFSWSITAETTVREVLELMS